MPSPQAPPDSPSMPVLQHLKTAIHNFQSSGRAFQILGPPPSRCKTLVILDSSFNPPTTAHMRMALSAIQDLRTRDEQLQWNDMRLLLLLAVNNADKGVKPAAFEQRVLMMQAFARDIRAQQWEEERERVQQEDEEAGADTELGIDVGLTAHPYFHDKSAAIAASGDYEGAEACEHVVLAGYDTLIRIFNPKYYKAQEGVQKTPMQIALDPFFARARLRITMRTDAEWGGKAEQLKYVEDLLHGNELEKVGGRREWAERVEMIEGRREEKGEEVVSSTLAREAAGQKDWERLRLLVPSGVTKVVEAEGLYADGG